MKNLIKILFIFVTFFASFLPVNAQNNIPVPDLNARADTATRETNDNLEKFAENSSYGGYFIQPATNTADGVNAVFINLAYGIKTFAIFIAIIFLIIGVIKLLFSDASDDDVKKWKNNIFWVAIGVFFLQISYSIWMNGVQLSANGTNPINAMAGWAFWSNIIEPIIGLLQYLAAFGFLAMAIYGFYVVVTGAGEEEKLEKGKKTILYGIVGFLFVQVPYTLVSMIYKGVPKCEKTATNLWSYSSHNCTSGENADLSGVVNWVGEFFKFLNGFLTLLCVLMAIYAGWLLLTSRGDEEKVKKVKSMILYIAIGLVLLVASHAIFRFFLLQDVPAA